VKYLAILAFLVPIAAAALLTYAQLDEQRRTREAVDALATAFPLGESAEILLDQPLAAVDDWEVRCGTVDGGAATDLTVDVDGGVHRTQALLIQNGGATCVAVGGPSVNLNTGGGASATRGASIGSGCSTGSAVAIDAKGARCRSRGAATTVQVLGGLR
jgi:hypothetical protein